MKRGLILGLFIALSAHTLTAMAEKDKKVSIPKQFTYDDMALSYNQSWEDKEIYLEENLDNDPEPEIIIGFVAAYKPKPDAEKEEVKSQFTPPKKEELPIIQNYVFYQIYDKGPDGYYKLVKTITGMDQIGTVKIIKLNKNEPKAIAISSPGGEHYVDLSIYQFKNGGYRLLFNKGGTLDVEIDTLKDPVSIRMGKLDKVNTNEPLKRETYIWDSGTNNFGLEQ